MVLSFAACCTDKSGRKTDNVSGANQNGQGNVGKLTDAVYDLDSLITAVEKAGAISGEPETFDVSDSGAVKGVAYGNMVFLAFDPSSSNAYFTAYDANQVTVKGKAVPIGAINGPYFMVFLDGKTDQNAVKAFRSMGYSY